MRIAHCCHELQWAIYLGIDSCRGGYVWYTFDKCSNGWKVSKGMDRIQGLSKWIKLTGERAKLDAKANGTYIVYKTDKGQIIREYANGEIEVVNDPKLSHE